MQIASNPFSDDCMLVLLHIKCTNISLLIIDDSRGNIVSRKPFSCFFQNDIDTLHNHLFYHSLEIRGSCLTKFSCKTLQNLPFLEYENLQGSFQFFNLQSFIFSLMNNALVYGNIDQSIHKGFSRSFHKAQAYNF